MDQAHDRHEANRERPQHDSRLDAVHERESETESILQLSDDGVGQNGVLPQGRNDCHGAGLLERVDEGTLSEQQHDHVVSSDQLGYEAQCDHRSPRSIWRRD